jgi:WD40 repeat protein
MGASCWGEGQRMNDRQNPYVGPRSFRSGETLFGRGHETAELIDLLIAERIVLMISPSGAGKSSLINTAVIPLMRERGFNVFPPMRVSRSAPSDVVLPSNANRFVVSLLLSLEEAQEQESPLTLDALTGSTFEQYLSDRVPTNASPDFTLFVFDQFEEVLTVDPAQRVAKQQFFDQVGHALRDRTRWALFAMREEYVAALMLYERSIPTRFVTRFRLDLLQKAAAMEAIREPARAAGFEFDAEAVEDLVRVLSIVRVQQPDGTITEEPGDYVEPVQLQVACRRLWATLPSTATKITADHVRSVGQVSLSLTDYYDDVVTAAGQVADGGERAVRQWVEKALISPNGIRSEVMQTPKTSAGLDNGAIKVLVDGYLVREDNRRGSTWYELAHDSLIEPAKSSNSAWFEKSLQPMQRQAELWEREGRPDRLLLRGRVLKEAESWARAKPALVLTAEGDFLKRSLARRRTAWTTAIATALALCVVLAFAGAWLITRIQNARLANSYHATLSHEAKSWTAYANSALERGNLDEAELLALRALPIDGPDSRPLLPDALSVLFTAMRSDRQRAILITQGAVKDVAINHDGTRIATASDDGTVRIFDAGTGAELVVLKGHKDKVNSVAFSPNGLKVVTASDDGTAIVWNTLTGETIETIQADSGHIHSAEYVADDNHIVTASEDGVRMWDLTVKPLNAKMLLPGDTTAMTVSPDGKLVAAAGTDLHVHVVGLSGEGVGDFHGPTKRINATSLSRDDQRIIAASDDGTAYVWSINSTAPERVFVQQSGRVRDANFSSDGSRIVAGSDEAAWLFDFNNSDRQLDDNQGGVSVARFSPDPDEQWIVTVSDDKTVRLRDPIEGTTVAVLWGHQLKVNAAVFTTDGKRLVTASDDGTARVWDTRPSQEMPGLNASLLTDKTDQIAFSLIAATRDPQSLYEGQVAGKPTASWKKQQGDGSCAQLETEPPDPRDAEPEVAGTAPPGDMVIASCRAEVQRRKDPFRLYQLAMGLEKSGAHAEAAQYYEDAASSGDAAAYFRLALMSFNQNDSSARQRAMHYLSQGAEAGDPYCHRGLAELYENPTTSSGDLGQALLHYLIALRLFENEVDIRNARYRAASIARNLPPDEVVKNGKYATSWLSDNVRLLPK